MKSRKLNIPFIVVLTLMSAFNMALFIKLHDIGSLLASLFGLFAALALLYAYIVTGPKR